MVLINPFFRSMTIKLVTDKDFRKKILTIILSVLLSITLVLLALASLPSTFIEGVFGENKDDLQKIKTYQEAIEEVEKIKDDWIEKTKEKYSYCDEIIIEDNFSLVWLDLIVIDSVRHLQDFDNVKKQDIIELGKLFLEKDVKVETYTETITSTNDKGEEKTKTVTRTMAIITVNTRSRLEVYPEVGIVDEDDIDLAENIYYTMLEIDIEGDKFLGWDNWNPGSEDFDFDLSDLPEGEKGSQIVQLAMTRLGDPYSQALRGQGRYVDCSYLTLWAYNKIGVNLPATAAEQARFCVNNNIVVSRDQLVPGDLVFWSHKYNGRYMNITHVGVYAGGGKVVDASSSKGKVVYRNLFEANKQVLYGRPHILAK